MRHFGGVSPKIWPQPYRRHEAQPRLLILGGGIKGTAIAALASLLDEFDVTLVERKQIGAGTTSTNHGRLHLGTAGWRKEKPELIQRRHKASELLRSLPDSTTCERDGVYCFEDELDAATFLSACQQNEIPAVAIERGSLAHQWINQTKHAYIIQVPEFSFNPARLAGRFAQTCVNHGGKIITGRKAERILADTDNLVVGCENGSLLKADAVVNTMTRWCNDLQSDNDVVNPSLEIKWFRWRLLCLRSEILSADDRLEQVTVVEDRSRKTLSAIPHRSWITLDYMETALEEIDSPEGDEQTDWRPIDLSDRIDATTFDAVRSVFRPLQSLTSRELGRHLFSMAGIQGRLANAKPDTEVGQIFTSDRLSRYYLTFGGQASSGLLDAIEVIERLGKDGLCTRISRSELLERLAVSLAKDPLPGSMGMVWENLGHPPMGHPPTTAAA